MYVNFNKNLTTLIQFEGKYLWVLEKDYKKRSLKDKIVRQRSTDVQAFYFEEVKGVSTFEVERDKYPLNVY